MAIALFGGTFDPFHKGHFAIVTTALHKLPITQVIIMPAWQNPFKTAKATHGRIRMAWIAKALKPYRHRCILSPFEITQHRSVKTIETVEVLKEHYGKIYLIIGADNLKSLHRWYHYRKLARLVTFVVATRDGIAPPKGMLHLPLKAPIDATSIRRYPTRRCVPSAIFDDVARFYTKRSFMTFEQRIAAISTIIDDKKGEAIEAVDLRGSDYFVDGVIIATTMASKHALSIEQALKEALRSQGEQFLHVDESDDWTIIDLGDLLIHLMSEEYRRKYHIEDFLKEFAAKKGK